MSVLMVFIPLAFILFTVEERKSTKAMTKPFEIIAFIRITITEDCLSFTVRLTPLHLTVVQTTIMGFARAKSYFLGTHYQRCY